MNNYPYANGTIKSIENAILDRNKLYKLANLDKNQFVKSLVEMDYGTDATNLETLISSEMMRVKELITSLTPNLDNVFLLFIMNDAQNIKVLYKVKYFGSQGIDHSQLLVTTGSIDCQALEKAILLDDFSMLSKSAAKLLKEIATQVKDLTNARLLSATIDNTIYQYALKKAKTNKCFETYFKSLIDFTNVITLIRSRNLGWEENKFIEMFIDGGTIKKDFFSNNYHLENDQKGFETLLRNFRDYYQENLTKILKDYFDKKNLNRLETKMDDLLIKIMSEYKNDAFDVGPMLFYYLEKNAEAKNIRMLYASQNIELSDLLAI